MKTGWMTRLKALFAAGVVGGGLLAITFALAAGLYGIRLEGDGTFLAYLAMAPVWMIVLIPAYLMGLAIFALPAWLVIEGTGVRSRGAAVLVGAAFSTAVAVASLAVTGLTAPDSLALVAGIFGLSGAAAGWTLHRVAYGRTTKP